VRHEEAAAFRASGFAKHTARLAVCVGTAGPGAAHLVNRLYDTAFDGAPLAAITGTTFHDLGGTRFTQSVDTIALTKALASMTRRDRPGGASPRRAGVRASGDIAGRQIEFKGVPSTVGAFGSVRLTAKESFRPYQVAYAIPGESTRAPVQAIPSKCLEPETVSEDHDAKVFHHEDLLDLRAEVM
jgi:hypothetical protein